PAGKKRVCQLGKRNLRRGRRTSSISWTRCAEASRKAAASRRRRREAGVWPKRRRLRSAPRRRADASARQVVAMLRVRFDDETFAQRSIGLRAIGCEKFKEQVAKSLKGVLNKHRRSVALNEMLHESMTPRARSAALAQARLVRRCPRELGLSSD